MVDEGAGGNIAGEQCGADVERGDPANRIGARRPMGRILVRGEVGHDIIPELYPVKGRAGDRQTGKGAFYQTDLELMLHNRGIDTLLRLRRDHRGLREHDVREANDRGFRCIVLLDCCALYSRNSTKPGLP